MGSGASDGRGSRIGSIGGGNHFVDMRLRRDLCSLHHACQVPRGNMRSMMSLGTTCRLDVRGMSEAFPVRSQGRSACSVVDCPPRRNKPQPGRSALRSTLGTMLSWLVADDSSAEMREMLAQQVAYFSRDELLTERANELRGADAAEAWAVTVELCGTLDWFLERMDPETRDRVMRPEPLSPELERVLQAMVRTR
jgi:hypothetical protein